MKQQADKPLSGDVCSRPYRRTYRILDSIFDTSPVLYCTVNGQGVILDCNDTYLKVMGFSRVESINTSIFDHIDPNSLVAMHEYLQTWQKKGIIINCEVRLRKKDGNTFPALLSAAKVHDEFGNVACSIALIDQTDNDKAKKDFEKNNEELKQKERLKNEFIAIASHELRTPIQPLLGYAILAKKGKVSQEAAWDGILKEARRLQQLANDILDVSRIESGSLMYQLEKVGIGGLLDSVVNSAKANLTKDVEIELALDNASMELEIDLDRSRMTQVLSNIIGNAIKFTAKGSVKIECRAFADNNKIEITVSDTGPGIPENIMSNLFGKFVTKGAGQSNGEGGTGLGLFISRAIVTAHKGEIYAVNSPSGGATFTIVLPIDRLDRSNITYE